MIEKLETCTSHYNIIAGLFEALIYSQVSIFLYVIISIDLYHKLQCEIRTSTIIFRDKVPQAIMRATSGKCEGVYS